MKIIGLSGMMGVGKSTAVDVIDMFTGGQVKTVKFAQPLYDMQEQVYRRIESAYQRPKGFIKDRKLLQWLGTDWGRGLKESLWVDIWKAEILKQHSFQGPHYRTVCVSDDVRFDNEAEAIKSLGGVIIKIERDSNTSHAQGGVGIVNHASEAGIADKYIDYLIFNNGTLKEYKDSLTRAITQIMGSSSD